jgi:hypothetical protein
MLPHSTNIKQVDFYIVRKVLGCSRSLNVDAALSYSLFCLPQLRV